MDVRDKEMNLLEIITEVNGAIDKQSKIFKDVGEDPLKLFLEMQRIFIDLYSKGYSSGFQAGKENKQASEN
jgi:hypothetical protein